MKVSQIGLISKKITKLDEQFPVQDILVQTGQLEQYGSGIYAYGHIPYLVKKNIDKVICKVLTKYGASEVLLPILQPENIWVDSGRLDKYVSDGVMFRCLTEKGNYCLAPTAEEAVVSFAKSRLCSYKQLPVTYFQIGPKFRNELRARGFLLRGKAFDMMDAYSFGRNQSDLDIEYEQMKKAYFEIFNTLGLFVQAVGADSGAIGGSKSEEFMCISDIGEDNILYDEKTGKAFNAELLERVDAKEYLLNTYGIENVEKLKPRKAVELGHIFQLGDKYSKSMNARFVDKNDVLQNFVMGCYGIGVSRTLAMVYEQNIVKTDKFVSMTLPINIAPYILYIVPKLDDSAKCKIAQQTYEKLKEKNVAVLFDDRNELSIGAKLKDSKITATPYVAVFGNTLDDGIVEVENNKTGQKVSISLDDFVDLFVKLNDNKEKNITLENLI